MEYRGWVSPARHTTHNPRQGQGAFGVKSQRVRWSGARSYWQACTTHAFLFDHCKLTSCTVISPYLPCQPYLIRLRLSYPPFGSIGFCSDRTHRSPVRTRAPDTPNFSNVENVLNLECHEPCSITHVRDRPLEVHVILKMVSDLSHGCCILCSGIPNQSGGGCQRTLLKFSVSNRKEVEVAFWRRNLWRKG